MFLYDPMLGIRTRFGYHNSLCAGSKIHKKKKPPPKYLLKKGSLTETLRKPTAALSPSARQRETFRNFQWDIQHRTLVCLVKSKFAAKVDGLRRKAEQLLTPQRLYSFWFWLRKAQVAT